MSAIPTGVAASGGWVFEIAMSSGLNAHDLIFDHNTTFTDNTFLYLAGIAGNGTTANAAVTNNLSAYGLYGIGGTGTDPGTPALRTYLSPYTWNDIALIKSAMVGARGIIPPRRAY